MASHPLPPTPPSPPSGGVRRHHTISSSSRPARSNSKEVISEETLDQQGWPEDEFVDQDWIGGVGAVGEKTSLHRQSSLPTRYHRALRNTSRSGSATPKTLNSLSTIPGHEVDEDDWVREMKDLRDDDDVHVITQAELPQHQQVLDSVSAAHSPLSPHFNPPSHVPSPPAASGVRRNQSLTYGAAVGGPRQMPTSLRRRGTHQGQGKQPLPQPAQPSPSPPDVEEDYNPEELYDEYDDGGYYNLPPANQQSQSAQTHIPTSSRERPLPWSANPPTGDWKIAPGSDAANNTTIDDVRRALATLELQNQSYSARPAMNFSTTQSNHPPRFTDQGSPNPMTDYRPTNDSNGNGHPVASGTSRSRQLPDVEGRKTPSGGIVPVGSAAYGPYVNQLSLQQSTHHQRSYTERDDRLGANSGTGSRDQTRLGRVSNPNLQVSYQQHNKTASIPNVPAIPQQYLSQQQPQSQQQQQQHAVTTRLGAASFAPAQMQGSLSQQTTGFHTPTIDVPALIAAKGYNPLNFDIRPQFARYFVIKSYTEDDVHKSLKYEIWSSTDPGNKRLDKAFKETAGRGPIYLFFSVNASGHFCGMAEMLTPVDYTRSSTVWASDKWKGVFKVRWIFVRDIPNVNLRHIKLDNTQERKPVTNSRDTQELLPDAGQEMLRVFHTHPARTSLLQDFAFYELQSMQKMHAQGTQSSPTQSPNLTAQSPPSQPQSLSPGSQHQPFNVLSMANANALSFQMPQMTPMMQLQMQMNMGPNPQFSLPQTQAMHASVMRHTSPGPGPLPVNGQGFMGMPNF